MCFACSSGMKVTGEVILDWNYWDIKQDGIDDLLSPDKPLLCSVI